MCKKFFCVLLSWAALSPLAGALELKNMRLAYGPLGATRNDTKVLPGDYLFMTYDIEGLKLEEKTGKASYKTILELYDSQNKVVFKKETPNEAIPMLGGTRMPGDWHVIMGREQPPGRYVVRLIVTDNLAKEFKYHDFRFELVPQGFGLVGVTAPAIGFPGQNYVSSFALVDMALDAKKLPDAEVTMKVLDEEGQQMGKTVTTTLPRDLPDEIDIKKENFVPVQFPIYLNRSGRFTVEIDARDKIASRRSTLRYTLHVLDLGTVIGK